MYCKCGCGGITPIAKRNRYELGHRKDEHIDYLHSHALRGRKRPPFTEEHKAKISKTRIERGVAKGSKNPRWLGGITKLGIRLRNSNKYKEWRTAVFERDNYTCVKCSTKRPQFEANHIEPFSVIMRRNNITTVEQALDCTELWNINNGETLCKSCHKETSSYGWKVWNNYIRPQGLDK